VWMWPFIRISASPFPTIAAAALAALTGERSWTIVAPAISISCSSATRFIASSSPTRIALIIPRFVAFEIASRTV